MVVTCTPVASCKRPLSDLAAGKGCGIFGRELLLSLNLSFWASKVSPFVVYIYGLVLESQQLSIDRFIWRF